MAGCGVHAESTAMCAPYFVKNKGRNFMKIELTYDPVKPETSVCIDGQVTDKMDIYGFLYPVRDCLIQTWLNPAGSWSGLAWQLRELSRGDDIELCFCGRAEDYADVLSALKEIPELKLTFREDDPLAYYTGIFAQMDSQIAAIFDKGKASSGKKTINELFPEAVQQIELIQSAPSSPWLLMIDTEKDLYLADQSKYSCCIVSNDYLDSFEKLDKLNSLTRSMRRCQDMICCCIDDSEKRSDFSDYASQFDFRIRFDSKESCVPILEKKYGVPYNIRLKLQKYREILALLEQCYEKREQISQRKKELSRVKDSSTSQIRELERCKSMLLWFAGKEPYMLRLAQLLKSGSNR